MVIGPDSDEIFIRMNVADREVRYSNSNSSSSVSHFRVSGLSLRNGISVKTFAGDGRGVW